MWSLTLLTVFSAFSALQANSNNNALYQCGVRRHIGIQLIERGWVAELGQWPWHAGVYHYDEEAGSMVYKCGGTLIDQRHVVTSAHCVCRQNKTGVVSMNPMDVGVHLGQYDLEDMAGVQERRVVEVHIHANFSTNLNDIAILVLADDVEYSDFVIPICLDQKVGDDISKMVGRRGSVAGWGMTENRTVSRMLRTAQMPVISHVECVQADPGLFGRYFDRGMFCAGERNGTSVCNGDSGGGLYISEGDRWVLKGVVSFSGMDEHTNCDTSNFAGFANVQYYLGWIRQMISGKDAVGVSDVKKRRSELECDKYRAFASKRLNGVCYNSRQPHSVALVYGDSMICSGVLISNKFVMTSCGCTGRKLPDNARVGDFINMNVISVICHPDFVRYENDLALLELETEVPLASTVIPACLANNWTENLYDTLLLTGFQLKLSATVGITFTEFVESVDNMAISREECLYRTQGTGIERITDSQICIYSPGKEIVHAYDYSGLAGGALQTFNSRSCMYTIMGICSGSATEESITLYSRVSRLLDWIEEVVWPEDTGVIAENAGGLQAKLPVEKVLEFDEVLNTTSRISDATSDSQGSKASSIIVFSLNFLLIFTYEVRKILAQF